MFAAHVLHNAPHGFALFETTGNDITAATSAASCTRLSHTADQKFSKHLKPIRWTIMDNLIGWLQDMKIYEKWNSQAFNLGITALGFLLAEPKLSRTMGSASNLKGLQFAGRRGSTRTGQNDWLVVSTIGW